MAGLYNNNINPIPGNGADVFGDKLVGNQFVDGVSQFTLGNFSVSSNFTQKDSRNFSLGNFSEPINLETLQITDISESKILASNKLEVFIKFDRSKVSNYTLYGSLRERLKVAVQQVINKFPASMSFNQFRTWDDYMSGETATNITFNPNTNETTLSLNLYTLFNPFGIEFTQSSLVSTGEEINIIRNLLFSFKKYSLYKNNVQYPLTFIEATSGNTNIGNLNIQVQGNPFTGNSNTTDTFLIKPNTLTTEESFDSMEDIERFLVERNQNPIYTAKFQQPLEADNGIVIKGTTSVTWPSTSDNNLIIEGDLFNSYLDKLYDIAGGFDKYKTNLISRFLTTAAFKEFDTYDEKVDKILKIYGRSFDDVKKYIDGLAYMTNVTYDSQNNIPNELLKNLAQTLGWGTPSAIKNEGFLDTIFKRNENPEYPSQGVSETPSELDFELYRRLLVNTAYLFKSKGTRRGIEFMLRFVGAPEALTEFNEHVYVAGQPMNMEKFKDFELKISGGTYTEEKPVLQTYFSAATNTFPPVVVTGFSQGYETVTRTTTINPQDLPVDTQGYPTVPRYGPNAYFQAGAGWFEETTEHRGKEVLDLKTSIFTGNTPFIKTKLNQFTYGEPYLELYRKFPDSKLGFPIVRTVDNKKSWVKKDSEDFRYLNLPDRGTNYQTKNDKLVVNVKNVDIFLNVGQGLEWDVWNFSKRYSCPFGPNVLSSPYPGVGGPDWTEILADATKLSFFEFAQKFWTVLINVKNRQTIDDGHAGGYPTLLSTYLDYMNSSQTCGIPSNQYTYEKMIAYVENMGDYWIRLLEQLIPATTIWQGGVKYENSIFHRYKYSYKHEPLCDDLDCFGSFVNCCYPISNDILVGAVNECGGLGFSGATWQNKITLGGTDYTGSVYYSSTTITDIPSTDTWLTDMVGILSGITTDVSDPNHTLTYYLINDNNTPTSIQIDQPNCIVIQGPCSGGTDLWNFNNGSQPNCFKSDICLTLNTCEICIPICYNDDHGDSNIPLYSPLEAYNYSNTVMYQGEIYIWEGGPSGVPAPEPTDTSSKNYWRKLPPIDCVPFLGGNNFMEGVDCDNFDEVIEPPEITGTTVTTQPEIFKDGIFNVGGQDCFESTYNPCEELVDACACMATYPDFPTNTLFTLGQVVCCPGNEDVTPTKWIRVNGFYDLISGTFTPSDTACKEVEIFVSPLCQYPQPTSVKCWAPCDNENSGTGISSGGKWGKEIINRRDNLPSIIVNDRLDPCDPQEPTEPTNICLECDEISSKNINLEFYDIPLNQVPERVMNFTMLEDELQENFTISPNSNLGAFESGFFKFKKARINLCCLGDKLTNYFRVYKNTGSIPNTDPQQISFGHVEQNFDINQNTIVEFYYLQKGPNDEYLNQAGGVAGGSSLNGGGKPEPQFNRNNPLDSLYMFIPQSTNSLQSDPVIVDNPMIGQNVLNDSVAFSDFFSSITEFCAQLGRKNPGGSVGQYRLNNVEDSTYLTDNGTGITGEEFNDIFDRYWALDPSFEGVGRYGALQTVEFLRMVGSILGENVKEFIALRLRYNWEMELSCNGRKVTLLTFNPLMSPDTTLFTNGDVPLSSDCGTDMKAPIINQNVSSGKLTINLAEKVSKGNIIDIPIDKTMIEIGDVRETLRNYNVVNSEIYIISNTNPLRNNRSIEYNSPVTITNTNGPTSETFVENNRKRIKLSWLDNISQGSDNNLKIEFISTENKARFAQDIRKKSVGNGVLTIPTEGLVSRQENNDENVTFYNPNNNRSIDIRVNVDGENTNRNYVTYTDLRDWALNTIGEIKNFSNKEIIYDEAGLVKGFNIGPTYTSNVANSQYHSGLVPIGDVETEFLISTLGSFEDYVKNQTGSTSSGLTITLTGLSTNYSGYTNLSGYTNNQEQNISPDFVFDISLKGSNMSLNSNVAMSDPIQGEFRLLGDDRQLQPSIPLPLVDREPVLFNLTRQDVSMGGEYFHYKVPKTQNYRLQYRSYLKLEYIDEGWCDYLNVYRDITQNTFPSNDYEFKQLINSSILYEGGFPSAPVEYQEGNVVNPYTQSYGSLVPVFGYNPNRGLGNFSTTVFVERVSSGTTSATTLGSYTVSSNSTTYPDTDETLILPYNNSDKFTDLYQCTGSTGTTAVFTKKCDIYIDTGCILLNEGDEIRLKVNVDWQSTTKAFTGSTTGTTVNLTLGSNYDTIPQSRPWFRIINKECNVNTSTNYLYWQPNEDSVLTESFMDGKNVPPAPDDRKGKLTLLNSIGEETNYLVPKVSRNNLNELTYLDIPKIDDYRGPLNLIPTDVKTNRWVKAIEEGRITDYRINDSKMLNKVGDTKVQWSLPVNVNDSIESISLDDSSNSFVVQSTVNIKGTGNSFDIINTLQPNVTTESIKEPKNESQDLMDRGTISYISSRPLEDRTIDFRENHTIIRNKVVIIESGVYDKDTPTPTPSRREFCKCSRNEYLEVPKDSNSPCSKWCCANNYKGTEYYGCEGKTPNQWKEGLSRETIVSSRPLIITEGKPPGVIRF